MTIEAQEVAIDFKSLDLETLHRLADQARERGVIFKPVPIAAPVAASEGNHVD